MDLKTAGCLFLLGLIILQIVGWLTGHNGMLTGTILTIIAGITGTIFGIKFTQFKLNK